MHRVTYEKSFSLLTAVSSASTRAELEDQSGSYADEDIEGRNPMGCFATPEDDAARAVAFLAGPVRQRLHSIRGRRLVRRREPGEPEAAQAEPLTRGGVFPHKDGAR